MKSNHRILMLTQESEGCKIKHYFSSNELDRLEPCLDIYSARKALYEPIYQRSMSKHEEFYDNPDIRARYFAHRIQPDNPNDTLERPIFLELAGNLNQLDIIDLGCGDAAFGKEALLQGAHSYIGIEASKAMVDAALVMLTHTSGKVHHQRLENWKAQHEQADLVSSRLALHYVENLEPIFQEAYQALRPGGRMIFSVEHPVITSNFASLAAGRRTTWLVDDYFKPGARVHQWLGQEVTKYHHTLEEYFDLMTTTGFQLERIRESHPQAQNFSSQEEYERRLRIPLFLFISARKAIHASPTHDRTS